MNTATRFNVGVYVDGYNLYYGGRAICGRSTAGWRWLDIRALTISLLAQHAPWPDAASIHINYCTAMTSGSEDQTSHHRQDAYLRALQLSHSVDVISLGNYVTRISKGPLAVPDRKGRPQLTRPTWPVQVRDDTGQDAPAATFMVSVARREEKGTDVNVASHLLVDALTNRIDAGIVISNDSDLAFPTAYVRDVIPLGIVNPTKRRIAGQLSGRADAGVGGHWWASLTQADFTMNQLPDPVGGRIFRPQGW